ncbi:hypothetical protein ACI797_02330 [Geodermatophilus sp. SYSU D00691]
MLDLLEKLSSPELVVLLRGRFRVSEREAVALALADLVALDVLGLRDDVFMDGANPRLPLRPPLRTVAAVYHDTVPLTNEGKPWWKQQGVVGTKLEDGTTGVHGVILAEAVFEKYMSSRLHMRLIRGGYITREVLPSLLAHGLIFGRRLTAEGENARHVWHTLAEQGVVLSDQQLLTSVPSRIWKYVAEGWSLSEVP